MYARRVGPGGYGGGGAREMDMNDMTDDFANVELARLRGVIEALRSGAVGAHRPFGEAAGRLLVIVRERLDAVRAAVVHGEAGEDQGRVAAAVDAAGAVVPGRELDGRAVSMDPAKRAQPGDVTFHGRSIRVSFDAGPAGRGWLDFSFRQVRAELDRHERQLARAMAKWTGSELERRAEERQRLERMTDPDRVNPLRLTA